MALRMDERSIRLAIFDLAGTTVYDGDAVGDTLRTTLLESAGVQVSRDAANAVMGRPKDRAIAELLTKAGRRSGAGDEHVLSLLGEFERRMLAHYRSSAMVRELDDATAVFEWLQGHGVQVGIDTGFSTPITLAVLERMGWMKRGLVDCWTCSDKVKAGRPAPYMIYQLMEQTGVEDVREVAKVGDTPADLMMGRNARVGLNVGVCGGSHTREQLAVLPHDVLLRGIDELPAILAVARDVVPPPAELA